MWANRMVPQRSEVGPALEEEVLGLRAGWGDSCGWDWQFPLLVRKLGKG